MNGDKELDNMSTNVDKSSDVQELIVKVNSPKLDGSKSPNIWGIQQAAEDLIKLLKMIWENSRKFLAVFLIIVILIMLMGVHYIQIGSDKYLKTIELLQVLI